MTKKEVEDLLQKTSQAVGLWDADAPPFQLSASIHYELAGKVSEGVYQLIRKDPSHYRESFRMTGQMMDFSEVEIASGDRLYIKRNTPIPTLPFWTARATLRSVKSDFSPIRLKVSKVYSAVVSGQACTCIDFRAEYFQKQACFNSVTSEPVFLSSSPVLSDRVAVGKSEWKRMHNVELTTFARLRGRLYPLSLKRTEGVEKLEITVSNLEEPNTVDEPMFVPPTGASSFRWCADPTVSGKLEMSSQILGEVKFPGALFLHFVLVGLDGRVQNTAAMLSAGSRIDTLMTERIMNTRFPVRSCGGTPIQYETTVPAAVAIQFPH